MDFFLVASRMGWTWQQWEDTPQAVRTLCWLYMQAEAEARAEAEKG
jgi:hypothetical protein